MALRFQKELGLRRVGVLHRGTRGPRGDRTAVLIEVTWVHTCEHVTDICIHIHAHTHTEPGRNLHPLCGGPCPTQLSLQTTGGKTLLVELAEGY